MRIYAWNVNGLRACANKGFLDWLKGSKGQIVTTQEVRALPEQLPAEVRSPPRWHTHFAPAERKGYSGVGTFSRYAFDEIQTSLGQDEFDIEGRLLMTRFGSLWVVNGYFPNGNGSVLPGGKRSNDRVPYKLRFYRRLLEELQPRLQAGEPILVMGDFNTAHTEIDLARPKGNKGTSGFLPEERAALDEWMQAGWVDSFRHFHPGAKDHYTWWAQRGGCRERNVGWRIDYILASPAAVPFLKAARIHPTVMGSDHCPLSVDVDPKIRSL